MISSRWPLPMGTCKNNTLTTAQINNIYLSENKANALTRAFASSRRRASTYESVDRLEASLHRLVHGFPGDNAGGFQLDSGALGGVDGAVAVDGVAEGVDDSAEEALTDGNIDDGTGSLDDIAFLDLSARHVGLARPKEH
jgi:hypothetical protein